MLHSLVTRWHARLIFQRLACCGNIPLSQNSVRLRKRLSFLGIGASIAFTIYHESSLAYNDSDEFKQTSTKPSHSDLSSAFEQDIQRQDMFIPDWTDNGIYRIDVASLPSSVHQKLLH